MSVGGAARVNLTYSDSCPLGGRAGREGEKSVCYDRDHPDALCTVLVSFPGFYVLYDEQAEGTDKVE